MPAVASRQSRALDIDEPIELTVCMLDTLCLHFVGDYAKIVRGANEWVDPLRDSTSNSQRQRRILTGEYSVKSRPDRYFGTTWVAFAHRVKDITLHDVQQSRIATIRYGIHTKPNVDTAYSP